MLNWRKYPANMELVFKIPEVKFLIVGTAASKSQLQESLNALMSPSSFLAERSSKTKEGMS